MSELRLRNALKSILEIGKRDMSNPKYDGYFEEADVAINEFDKGNPKPDKDGLWYEPGTNEAMITIKWSEYLDRLDLATQNALEVAAKVCDDYAIVCAEENPAVIAAAIRAKKVK